ncbi:MAG: hypothetical protein ABI432_00095 [Flavobacteriales bacterium]
MRGLLLSLYLLSALDLCAQFPPIDLEWSAIRPYTIGGEYFHISRDRVYGQYIWAVLFNADGSDDELANTFTTTGMDVTPMYPYRFNVGSLDVLIDMTVVDSTIHRVMHHMNIGGNPQDVYWHLDGQVIQTDGDGYLWDYGNDLLVTNDAVYGCGGTDISFFPGAAVARLVKQDLQSAPLWNVTWADPNNDIASFSSVAVLGDTVYCAAFPNVVMFDNATGALLGTFDISGQGIVGPARFLAHGNRLYWCAHSGTTLHFGYRDMVSNQSQSASLPNAPSPSSMVIDGQDRLWLTGTAGGSGRWYRFDEGLVSLGAGTLYESISDACFVNGKICFTGVLDGASSTAYLITGTPQP